MSVETGSLRLPRVLFALLLLAVVDVAIASKADELVQEAKQYLADGEAKAAAIQLKNALQADPAHVEARLMLGSLHLRSGEGAAAAKEFRRARELGAGRPAWLPGYAQALAMQNDFQTLLDEVQVDDQLPPEQQAALHALRGNANLALRRPDAAITEYDAALVRDPANPMARLGKVRMLITANRIEEALVQLDQVLADHPDHVESRLGRGDILRRLQRLDEAAADYTRAAELAPANPRAHVGLAVVHIAQRDMDAARKDLAALERLAGDLPVAHYLQALVAFYDKDLDRASDELQVLLRAAPGSLQAQLLYGVVSYARNEYTIADDYLTRVFASVPGNVQIVKLLGASRLKLRQPDRAIQVLEAVVDDNTDDAQLLALLGTAYIQSGDNSRGAEYIQRAVDIDPDQALLRTQLAIGQIATGDTAAAISQLESAVALDQDVLQADVLLVLSYLNKREYDKAIAASEALEQRMADSPIPYNLTGLAYLARRQFDLAEARFKLALEKDPGFLVARMNMARLALAAGRPDAAEAAYRAVLKQDPKHVGAMMGLAALARSQKDLQAAEDWLRRANRADPDALQPIIVLAEMYLRQNEGLKANSLLSGLPPQQAGLPALLRLKGMAQLQTGDYASARHTLQQLAAKQPGAIEAWFQLARAQAAAADPAAARESFQRAIALDETHKVPLLWIGLGELEVRERRWDAALQVAQQMKTYFPGNVAAYDIEAAAHRGKGQIAEALAATEAALGLERSSRRTRAFASQLVAAARIGRAIEVLQDWIEQQPEDGAAWALLGMLHQQKKDEDNALQAYERALEHSEANPVLLNNMAWLYLDRDGVRAIDLATRAYELAPSRAEIVDTYGWVLFRHGRRSEGLAALQQASIIAPRNAEITLHVAQALHGMQRDTEARPMLERIVREQPGSPFAASASALLDQLRD